MAHPKKTHTPEWINTMSAATKALAGAEAALSPLDPISRLRITSYMFETSKLECQGLVRSQQQATAAQMTEGAAFDRPAEPASAAQQEPEPASPAVNATPAANLFG